jgi:hypothetical protein
MKTAKTWEDLYATKVKPQEILDVVSSMARLHEEGKNPDFYTAMFLVTDLPQTKEECNGEVLRHCGAVAMPCQTHREEGCEDAWLDD